MSESDIDEMFRRGVRQMVAAGARDPRTPSTGRRGSLAAGVFAAFVLLAAGAAATISIVIGHQRPPVAAPLGANAVVPWAALSVPSAPAQTAATAIACTETNLQATSLRFDGYGPPAEVFSGTLTLIGGSPCWVSGTVSASFFLDSGVAIPVWHPPGEPTLPRVTLSPARPLAALTLRLFSWCLAGEPTRMTITLADGGHIGVAIAAPKAACPRVEYGLTAYSLDVTALPGSPTPPPTSTRPAYSVSIDTLAEASPGEHYGYRVTIANHSAAPLTLQPCPSYVEGLQTPTGFSTRYALNCAAAHPIPPRGSEVFQMYIDVPKTAEAGVVMLTWGIEDELSPTAISAPLTIVG